MLVHWSCFFLRMIEILKDIAIEMDTTSGISGITNNAMVHRFASSWTISKISTVPPSQSVFTDQVGKIPRIRKISTSAYWWLRLNYNKTGIWITYPVWNPRDYEHYFNWNSFCCIEISADTDRIYMTCRCRSYSACFLNNLWLCRKLAETGWNFCLQG